MSLRLVAGCLAGVLAVAAPLAVSAQQCPSSVPVEGAPPPNPLPLFPADNWWNADVSSAPVDAGSAAYISFINNGGTRRLHPDFGGEVSTGSVSVYGMPWAIVDGTQPKQAVQFQYWSESDGVDLSTGKGVPFYPIPAQAITQPHWIEGGEPGNVSASSDRHLLVIDCTNKYLYELFGAYYDTSRGQWTAGSGAFFDMNTNDRRPEGWTSADAAGLAIFPGLVRYDEAWNPAVTEIGHALRVTVRSTNGHVYPASHTAGSTSGALPMGARLRLKASVNGTDPALRSSNPNVQKIFRAMQKHGLIVADNGSDMYISGTFDTRWDSSILNPAFSLLSASDFEVIQLGWKPAATAAALGSLGVSPSSVVGGTSTTGTVTLSAAAPAGGAIVSLSSGSSAASVPASVTVPQGATSASFTVGTSAVTTSASATLSATYAGVTKTAAVTVNPPVAQANLSALSLAPTSVVGGQSSTGTVSLSAAAPAGGAVVSLSSASSAASVPVSVTVAAGATSATFPIATSAVTANVSVTVSATYAGGAKTAILTITPAPAPAPAPAALATLSLNPATVVGGASSTGRVTLTAPAPAGGSVVTLASSAPSVATVPASVTVPDGASSATFTVTTTPQRKRVSAAITAGYAGAAASATLTVTRK